MAKNSEQVLKQELSWAGHLGLRAVIIAGPTCAHRLANYARTIKQYVEASIAVTQVWLRISLPAPISYKHAGGSTSPPDGWNVWANFRQMVAKYYIMHDSL